MLFTRRQWLGTALGVAAAASLLRPGRARADRTPAPAPPAPERPVQRVRRVKKTRWIGHY